MEQPPIKRGNLYRPQKGKGMGLNLKKCWVKRWALLYPASETQPPRLETFDSKEAVTKEGAKPTVLSLTGSFQATQTTMHRSRDFVLEIGVDDKIIDYAVDSKEELDTWLQVFTEVAAGRSGNRTSFVPDLPSFGVEAYEGLQENTLYDSYETMTFDIAIKPTAFSDSLNLQGRYSLQIDSVKLSLMDENTNNLLYAWPYRYLRRYGRDKTSFSMEAGRKCESGPGLIVFETKEGNDIFHNIQNFVNNISGRQATPPVQSHQLPPQESVRKPANPGKGPAKSPAVAPRGHPVDPMSAMIAQSSLFKQKLAERKGATEQADEPPVKEHLMRKPKLYHSKMNKEQQPAPSEPEADPLYSEVQENTGKGAGEPAPPVPEGEYALPEGSETHFRPHLPIELPESSEYDLLDSSNPPGHLYDTTVEEPLGDGWMIHGRTEDNIHTETYMKGLPILDYEGSGSDQEPVKPVAKPAPVKSKPPPKPTPLPKARPTVRTKIAKTPNAKKEAAVNDSSDKTYDTVGSLPAPGASAAPTAAADGQDTYDHFVRPAIAHPKPAPRKCNPSQAPQVDAESEIYDHLQRETNTGGPRMPLKPHVPKQRSLDPDDVYDVLSVDDQGTGGSGASANVGAGTLPEESQYIEAVHSLTSQQSAEDPGENNMEENAYDVVAFQ